MRTFKRNFYNEDNTPKYPHWKFKTIIYTLIVVFGLFSFYGIYSFATQFKFVFPIQSVNYKPECKPVIKEVKVLVTPTPTPTPKYNYGY